MVTATRAWALERNDRRLAFVSGPGATMFAESGASGVTAHRHPAWKVVLPLGGRVEVRPDGGRAFAAAGVVVPPEFAHACAASSAYVALFIDPWDLPPGPGCRRLDASVVRRLHAALGDTGTGADLGAARAELAALVGGGRPLDPRVAHAIRESTRVDPRDRIQDIAADVGLSPPRLRALVRESVGIPLVRLRRWARLRAAVAGLSAGSVAAAAATAGFADQAHLARTARGLLGRPPGSIAGSSA
jgi:AraC-like DNA-binding protein